jgi:CRP/FNR family transcriptional regulator, nitrogen fixation regulation protein
MTSFPHRVYEVNAMHAYSISIAATQNPLTVTNAPSELVTRRPQAISFYEAGSEIYGQGEKVTGLYQVEYGAIRVYRLLADGRRQISAFYLASEIFGFEADRIHHFFAEALVSTGVRVIRPSVAADMSAGLLPLALKSLTRAQEHLLVLGRQTALERVAAFLVDLAERQGGLSHMEIPMSRMDIADYLGLTIETVSRAFSKLKQTHIIRLSSSRSIEILKWDSLHAMCE